ncbi:class I SAM-dependent methyltransferase [Dokdonella sp.]|uniref:class I SAM-dependent methyltransferase n=1 Tax=Dokdonella sp. TaxID=2291710 RepID=UPI003527B5EA
MGTDKDWEKWGRDDPYFGVLSDEKYRSEHLSDENLADFFASGEEHVRMIIDTIRGHFSREFVPESALDFGCGVGRLLIPLARVSKRATGIDVSSSMLEKARQHCARLGIENVQLALSDDALSRIKSSHDLIHSHIVFAHIHPSRGMKVMQRLAEKVSPGGFMAVQFLYACNAPGLIRGMVNLRYRIPLLNALRNMLRGRPVKEPAMQLHVYNLPAILQFLNRCNFGEALLITDRFDNDTFDSAILIAQRSW